MSGMLTFALDQVIIWLLTFGLLYALFRYFERHLSNRKVLTMAAAVLLPFVIYTFVFGLYSYYAGRFSAVLYHAWWIGYLVYVAIFAVLVLAFRMAQKRAAIYTVVIWLFGGLPLYLYGALRPLLLYRDSVTEDGFRLVMIQLLALAFAVIAWGALRQTRRHVSPWVYCLIFAIGVTPLMVLNGAGFVPTLAIWAAAEMGMSGKEESFLAVGLVISVLITTVLLRLLYTFAQRFRTPPADSSTDNATPAATG